MPVPRRIDPTHWLISTQVKDVDAILAKYLGREDALFARLEQKYAAPSPARASPVKAAPAPATTHEGSTNKKAHDAKADARAAMEARLNARLARKK